MRLTTRGIGDYYYYHHCGTSDFFWSLSIFSFADGEETMAISTKISPWHFDCCPGSDPSWKEIWEERNQQL